jgi:hypothetical protein
MFDESLTAPLAKLSRLVDRFPPTSGRRRKRKFQKVRVTGETPSGNLLDNASIAELLIRKAETTSGHRKQALRRAARTAFRWKEEAADVASAGRSLTELEAIGPWPAACTAGLSRRRQLLSRHRFVGSFSHSLKHAEL